MMGLQPTGPTRVNLEVIVPSPKGLTPEMWKQTATLCPLEWPSNSGLLRLWHTPKSFHQYAAQLKQQVQHQHMFTHWEVNRAKLASRVLFQRPAYYLPETILQQHVRERVFPDRKLRKVWKFDTLCETTLWIRVKRHVTHRCVQTMHRGYVEGYCKKSWKIGREHSTYCGKNLVCDHPVSQYSIGLRTYHF